jgi:Circularly permutated YpsA SLOG family
MLVQVISGGQTGADRGALIAAKACGLATGGWMPKGFLTLEGPRPDLAKEFGLQEHTSPKYPPRTRRNVQLSDATIRFARHWQTPGEHVTLKFLLQYRKPYLDVSVNAPPTIGVVAEWLLENRVRILNVAGNAERSAPGIEEFVDEYLSEVLRSLALT